MDLLQTSILHLQLGVLRGALPPFHHFQSSLPNDIYELATYLVRADFDAFFNTTLITDLIQVFKDQKQHASEVGARAYMQEQLQRVENEIQQEEVVASNHAQSDSVLPVPNLHLFHQQAKFIFVAIAFLHLFVQQNIVGPSASLPSSLQDHLTDTAITATLDPSKTLNIDGEELAPSVKFPTLLQWAIWILVDAAPTLWGNTNTVHAQLPVLETWYRIRALTVWNRMLSNRTPTIQRQLTKAFTTLLGKQPVYGYTNGMETKGEELEHGHEHQHEQEQEQDTFLFSVAIIEKSVLGTSDDSIISKIASNKAPESSSFSSPSSSSIVLVPSLDPALEALALIELALFQFAYCNPRLATENLQVAAHKIQLSLDLTGALGVRTKYQQKPTGQLVLAAQQQQQQQQQQQLDAKDATATADAEKANSQGHASQPSSGNKIVSDVLVDLALPLVIQNQNNHKEVDNFLPQSTPFTDDEALKGPRDIKLNDTDLLGYISLLENSDAFTDSLSLIAQVTIMAFAEAIMNLNAKHSTREEEMVAYALRVLAVKAPTNSMIRALALLMRTRVEQYKGRFQERSLLQLEAIIDYVEVNSDQSTAADRLLAIHCLSFPPMYLLRKEFAVLCGENGMVKSAAEIFIKLEMWNEAIDCHQLMGNLGVALEILKDRIEKVGESPRYLCVMGDLTRKAEYYEKAWALSEKKYSRAKRSLGRSYLAKGQYAQAITHYEDSLKINPLYPDIWFSLGYCALQINDYDTAARAYTKVVQQDPENGEAWSNLGNSLYRKGMNKEALIAFTEASKTKRDSWHIWDNLLQTAMAIKKYQSAVNAMDMLLNLKSKEGIRGDSIRVIVDDLVVMAASQSKEDRNEAAIVIRKLLPLMGRCSSLYSTDASLWDAYASLHELNDNPQRGYDCRQKQVRAISSSEQTRRWDSEKLGFFAMVQATIKMTRDAIDTRKKDNVHACVLHIASVLHRCKEIFEMDPLYIELQQVEKQAMADEATL